MMRMLHDPMSGNLYGFDDDIISKMIAGACYSKGEIDTKLAAVLKLCGTKATYNELLQVTGQEVGDVWIVVEDQAEYAWVKSGTWEELGPVIDLTPFALKTTVGTLPTGYDSVVAYITETKTTADQTKTDLANYKTTNDTALSAVRTTANGAVQSTDFETFKSTNTQAIAAAKKSGDDAATELASYKLSNNQAVQTASSTANAANQAITSFKTAQLVFQATVADISSLTESTDKVVTEDTVFSRRKTYYRRINNSYITLTLGVDYQAQDNVASFGEDVYEAAGVSVSQLVSKINELVSAGNALIAAHKQEPEPAS